MVAQIIVHAKNRNAAADKLIDYLNRVTISGICTNIPLLRLVLADDVFRKGKYDTDYLPQLLQRIDIEKRSLKSTTVVAVPAAVLIARAC